MQVLGLNTVTAGLAAAEERIGEAAEVGAVEAAERIRQAWVDNIIGDDLILTGHYRDSVRVVPDEKGAVVSTDAEYAPFLEFGTSRQEAHHPAERASDENHDAVLDAVGDAVGRVI